jgi:hypothetical protein
MNPFKLIFVFVIAILFITNQSFAQMSKFKNKLGKKWSYIEGTQSAVNDTNRVYYLIANQYPNGLRVNNFNQMEPYYKHDSEFIHAQIPANKVYDWNKNIEGHNFFISKTEVSNKEYNEFVIDCNGSFWNDVVSFLRPIANLLYYFSQVTKRNKFLIQFKKN